MRGKIYESKKAVKSLDKLPREILRSYEIWVCLVEENGTSILRKFPGYHDEKLSGNWQGYRSSRLNIKWRVIYKMHKSNEIEIVDVIDITPHNYRRKM